MRLSFIVVFFIFITTGCSKQLTNLAEGISYANPLLQSGPDPWVIQKDSFYYYTHTSGDKIQIWKTKSLSRLGTAETKVVWTPSPNSPNSNNLWAPELHFLDNKWFLYYAAGTADAGNQRLYVLENSSADPLQGTWIDKGRISDPAADIYSIDGTILEYNNKKYLIWSSLPTDDHYTQAIYIAQMANPWTLATSRSLISSPQFAWEKFGSPASGKGINEGPEILRNPNGDVFLIFSASGCGTDSYGLGLLALKNGGDPLKATDWTKNSEPVFKTRLQSSVFGPGHCAFFKSPDGKENWILYHAHTNPAQACDWNRNPRIQKFTWNADGTPNFGNPSPAFLRIMRPSGEKDQ